VHNGKDAKNVCDLTMNAVDTAASSAGA